MSHGAKAATAFLEEVRRRLPVAIQRIRPDHGAAFVTGFTWHLHDIGIAHRPIPRDSPESNEKVQRSYRTDDEEVSRRVTFRSLQELRRSGSGWGKTAAERLCELRITVPQPVRQIA